MSTTHDHKATATALMGGGLSLTYGVRLKKLAAGAFLAGTLCALRLTSPQRSG